MNSRKKDQQLSDPHPETPDEDGLKVLVNDGDGNRDWMSSLHLPSS